ncbi:MAG: T9SS type A sorting domain-containing protein [Flavobacteriales bacterium]|nr:T9SS type A sorting domain-containing protein [Flavobacteriales bacterium]
MEGTFVADSAYTHMVWATSSRTRSLRQFQSEIRIPWTGITYYLIDGVEVIPLEKAATGLGVEGHLPTGEPTIQWAWGTIQVRWEGEAYKAEIMDALGRIVEKVISKGEQLDVPKPGTAGVYYLRLVSREKQRVVKFEVW